MRIKAFISIFSVICLFGCKNPTETSQTPNPFSLQKAWIYSVQTYDLNGPTGAPTSDSVYVDSTITHNSKRNYYLSNHNVIIVDSNDFMTGYSLSDCICEAAKIPAVVGDTVLRRDSIPTKVNGNIEFGSIIIIVENADTTISVPAGTFRCAAFALEILLNNTPSTSSGMSYISSTAGLVESDSYIFDQTTGKTYLSRKEQLIRMVK